LGDDLQRKGFSSEMLTQGFLNFQERWLVALSREVSGNLVKVGKCSNGKIIKQRERAGNCANSWRFLSHKHGLMRILPWLSVTPRNWEPSSGTISLLNAPLSFSPQHLQCWHRSWSPALASP
jgi:hypothetical protein